MQFEGQYVHDKNKYFTGKAFVTFEFENEKNDFLRRNKKFKLENQIKVKQAYAPTDINWVNYGYPNYKKIINRIYSRIVAILAIVIGGVILVILKLV